MNHQMALINLTVQIVEATAISKATILSILKPRKSHPRNVFLLFGSDEAKKEASYKKGL